jgi:hypothetical protein
MPYKATGKWVLVKRKGRWVRLRQMVSEAAAKAHAAALNAATRGH